MCSFLWAPEQGTFGPARRNTKQLNLYNAVDAGFESGLCSSLAGVLFLALQPRSGLQGEEPCSVLTDSLACLVLLSASDSHRLCPGDQVFREAAQMAMAQLLAEDLGRSSRNRQPGNVA